MDAPHADRALVRRKDRAAYDWPTIFAILDEALLCHVGFSVEGQVFVVPMAFARIGETLYVHGGAVSRMLKVLRQGVPVCVTVTLLDGLVLARSAFHHSMNYRSVVAFGTAREVTDAAEKARALEILVDRMDEGRAKVARPPNARELVLTRVLSVPIEEASAKSRRGPPIDDAEDMALGVWAGEVPLRTVAMERVRDGADPGDLA
jgi:nitroimidazol reductase NimA-like FMN-containing flavoprotein (pyridoxamine 5'-phosphate oxidase superfamily)